MEGGSELAKGTYARVCAALFDGYEHSLADFASSCEGIKRQVSGPTQVRGPTRDQSVDLFAQNCICSACHTVSILTIAVIASTMPKSVAGSTGR
jgi:hypothetical protein